MPSMPPCTFPGSRFPPQNFVPPSGHIAGCMHVSTRREASTRHRLTKWCWGQLVSAQAHATTRNLNPLGVNCIRAFPGQDIRIGGRARWLVTRLRSGATSMFFALRHIGDSIVQNTWVVLSQRPNPVGRHPPRYQRLLNPALAPGSPVRQYPRRGLLRQVRRRNQST